MEGTHKNHQVQLLAVHRTTQMLWNYIKFRVFSLDVVLVSDT